MLRSLLLLLLLHLLLRLLLHLLLRLHLLWRLSVARAGLPLRGLAVALLCRRLTVCRLLRRLLPRAVGPTRRPALVALARAGLWWVPAWYLRTRTGTLLSVPLLRRTGTLRRARLSVTSGRTSGCTRLPGHCHRLAWLSICVRRRRLDWRSAVTAGRARLLRRLAIATGLLRRLPVAGIRVHV